MQFIPIKTRILLPPKDDLFQIFDEYVLDVQDGDILFITSKVVAIHQGRCIPTPADEQEKRILKEQLIKQEADKRIVRESIGEKNYYLTMKENLLTPSVGIDESNANGHFILRPNHLSKTSKEIHDYFTKKFNITKLWIILTDSCSKPLKLGVVGIGIYAYGIKALLDKRGDEDLFGKRLAITQVNVIDSLSAIAVYLMGEGNERTPILIGRDIPNIAYTAEDSYDASKVSPEEDIFRPLLHSIISD